MNEYHENLSERHAPQAADTPHARRSRPKKGRYLKKSPPPKCNHRRRRRRLNPGFVVTVVLLVAMLMGITFLVRSCAKPSLNGRWDLDGTTVYEFGKNGKGTLILMVAEYEFHYTVDGDQLYIDFVDEAALDAKYTFAVDKKMLFLTGGPGDAKSEFVLTRIY